MKSLIPLLLCIAAGSPLAHAEQCAMDTVTESSMRLSGYLRSQAASSFRVRCGQAYNIRFSSMNLVSSNGDSYVRNGAFRLATRMRIEGANKNEWNALLSPRTAGRDNKFAVVVELEETPSVSTPAGIYRDVVYVSLAF